MRTTEPKETDCNLEPYYEGFTGKTIKLDSKKYLLKGNYKVLSVDTVQITELPVGTWTTPYKVFLESLMEDKKKKPIVKKIKDMCTDSLIDYTVTFHPGILSTLISKKDKNIKQINMLEKTLKLYTTKSNTNMNLFDNEQKLKKYSTIKDIIDIYYPVRYQGYIDRKEHMLKDLLRIIKVLSNKARFIEEQCDNVIDLRKKKKQIVIELLKERNYDIIDNDPEYKYLRSMTFEQLEEENIEKLRNQCNEKKKLYDELYNKTPEKLWLDDLKCFDKNYLLYLY